MLEGGGNGEEKKEVVGKQEEVVEELNNFSLEDIELTSPNLWQKIINWFKKLFELR